MPQPSIPPVATRKPHSFSHHGIQVDDPYAWLRDPGYPEVNDSEILSYLKQENSYFENYMAPLAPVVEQIFEELKARQPDDDASVPYLKNGFWYQWRFEKDAQYRRWYRAPETTPQAWQLLLDEPALADGHEYFSLGALAVSPDGRRLAYSIDVDGSERYTLHIIDIQSRQPLSTPIPATMGSPIWDAHSNNLFYVVVNEQWQPLEVYQHSLLDTEGEDRLVHKETDTTLRVSLDLSQSEEWVILNYGGHTSNAAFVIPRDDFNTPAKLIEPRRDDVEYYVDHGNGEFVIRSNVRQANFDIYRVNEEQPGQSNWQTWVAGDERHYITGHVVFKSHLLVEERIDGLDQIRVIDKQDNQHYVAFPEATYEAGIGLTPSFDSPTVRINYASMVTPNTVFEYDLTKRSFTTLKVKQIPSGYDASQFTTERLTATARDGVEVPVSLVYHRDTPVDGRAPLYLYAYGAYGHAIAPGFSAARISLLERGFIFAIAHIRGGDDLGYHWYTDGKLDKRTNTFNDFVDVAKHLIQNNYATAGNIAIAGGSAGGELMGAVVNQAPELWGAVASHVPFVDVLNTMLDETLPLTPPEWAEWGNPITDQAAFEFIRSYSPYDQLRPGAYPPIMVTAGLNDPRVTYWEPAKYVAKLRTLKQDSTTLLLKTNMGAGHGGQSGRFDALKELAEEYAFFLHELGVSNQAPTTSA
ncbi:dapb1 [Symbiodinium necroappetens]|uniref:Prolyl endopeptidase n=1 Tax=Symbiodinium necroappetens TaxID=1628268 RepID=A0A812ISF0_9DINO|nr:dapb1 [Symbiodinium necroappetens]